jgi:hypothetical protein
MMSFSQPRRADIPVRCDALAAQTFSLLYRRFSIGRTSKHSSDLLTVGSSQNTILRYGRLKICATVRARGACLP